MRRPLALVFALAVLVALAPARAQQPAQPAPKAEPPKAEPPKAETPKPAPAPVTTPLDPEELRRQILEEVRRELQKTKDEVKQETAWVQQDSATRIVTIRRQSRVRAWATSNS